MMVTFFKVHNLYYEWPFCD